jgi:hypothetical protein
MTFLRYFVLLLLAPSVLGAPASARSMEAFVKLDGGKPALLFTVQDMAVGEQVQIQSPDANGEPACCLRAAVVKKVPVPDDEAVSDASNDKPMLAYRLKVDGKVGDGLFIGMAVIGSNLKVSAYGPNLHVRDGATRFLMMTCLSSEGLHLFRATDQRMVGHLYMGLGYDVEPSCPDRIYGQ